jgi:hypothetical protein
MAGEPNESSIGKPSGNQLYFLSLYFITVGVLYLWGYWSTFNVNILEYVGLADVIRLTAYPVTSAFVFMAIGAMLGEVFFGQDAVPAGGGRATRIGGLLRKCRPLLIVLYLAVTVAFTLGNIPNKWSVLPVLFAIPFYLFAKQRSFLAALIPRDSARSVVVFLFAVLPTFSYGQGRLQADAIVNGNKFEYLLSPIDQIAIAADASPVERIRYLGHAGDLLFFLNPARSVLIITKFQDGKALLLKHFDRSSEKPPPKEN